MDKQALETNLAHFTGSETFTKYIFGTVLTEGVVYLAREAQCFWLIDIISSYQHERKFKSHASFQVWELKLDAVGDGEMPSATVTASDGDGNLLATQHVSATDFPLNKITLWFSNGTILLPSEY